MFDFSTRPLCHREDLIADHEPPIVAAQKMIAAGIPVFSEDELSILERITFNALVRADDRPDLTVSVCPHNSTVTVRRA